MRVAGNILTVVALVAFGLAVQGSRGDERKTSPERQTAELLDTVIQPRFQVTNGRDFGLSRIAPKIQGHTHIGALLPESDSEKRALDQVSALGRDYRLGFVHTGYQLSRATAKPIPMKAPDVETIWRNGEDFESHKDGNDNLVSFKEQILPLVGRLERGDKLDIQQGGWKAFLRPIKAEKDTCASCHVGVKTGQVMGAMVYYVKNTRLAGAGH